MKKTKDQIQAKNQPENQPNRAGNAGVEHARAAVAAFKKRYPKVEKFLQDQAAKLKAPAPQHEIWEIRCPVPKAAKAAYFAAAKKNPWGEESHWLSGEGKKTMATKFLGTRTTIQKAEKTLRKLGLKPVANPAPAYAFSVKETILFDTGCRPRGLSPEKLLQITVVKLWKKIGGQSQEADAISQSAIEGLQKTGELIELASGDLALNPACPQYEKSRAIREMNYLLEFFQEHLHELAVLEKDAGSHWGGEDPFYRYFHHSFKVYSVQTTTAEIVGLLDRAGNHAFGKGGWKQPPFVAEILRAGQGKTFRTAHNKAWAKHAKPLLDAFLYAREFLRLASKYAVQLDEAPNPLPSGWAALLYYYNKR